MKIPTVGENQDQMRELALELMRENYKAADYAAKHGQLAQAKGHLEAAERWRVKAREHANY